MTGTALSNYRVIRLKHIGRYLAGAATVAVLAAIVISFARAQIDWATVGEFFTAGTILTGFVVTIVLTVISMAIGIVLGVLIAVMRLSHNPVVSGIGWIYVWVFRGTPVYLQLLLWFNIALIFPMVGIPGLFQGRTVDLVTPFVAAILGLGLNQAAYTSEVVRAGILSVDEGQTEAAKALGIKGTKTMSTIVLPQAMRVILPPVGNEVIGMLKTTSLASAIGASEILDEAQHIYLVNNLIMELLLVTAIWYLIAVSVLSSIQYYVERYFARGSTTAALPPTPIQRVKNFFGTPGRTK
ncbi:amino acid ABC transporter permease [Leucobacter sp. wl10]|uniref:amino acid ABC transporter permease n=1 Tax=Leucobacter sp. wl10 TaxID=2304677 RepID=UPI000E5B6566|nr:amino acid ABC transporter permease [Leucobacter sp. wl10]RGE20365.1 amino acid ABC transporter permease [Leucobacter sp. wl10]